LRPGFLTRPQERQKLKILRAHEFAFHAYGIPSTQCAEAIDIRSASVIGERNGNIAAITRPKIEDTEFLIDTVHGAIDNFRSSRGRSLRESRPGARLNGFLYPNNIYISASRRSRWVRDPIARLDIVDGVLAPVIDYPCVIEVIRQSFSPAIRRHHINFPSGSIHLNDFALDFTGTKSIIFDIRTARIAQTILIKSWTRGRLNRHATAERCYYPEEQCQKVRTNVSV
jgi:hypothetical protein